MHTQATPQLDPCSQLSCSNTQSPEHRKPSSGRGLLKVALHARKDGRICTENWGCETAGGGRDGLVGTQGGRLQFIVLQHRERRLQGKESAQGLVPETIRHSADLDRYSALDCSGKLPRPPTTPCPHSITQFPRRTTMPSIPAAVPSFAAFSGKAAGWLALAVA